MKREKRSSEDEAQLSLEEIEYLGEQMGINGQGPVSL
jgi:hypothetical protein